MLHQQTNALPRIITQRNFDYLPATLKELRSGWVIEYYATDPRDMKLRRMRAKVSHVLKRYTRKVDARRYLLETVANINDKLKNGWNPFFEGEDSRLYTKLSDVTECYLKEKAKELRKDTMRSYSSFVNILCTWVNRNNANLFASMFNKSWAVRFMDYVYNERGVSQRSYNNYLKTGKCLFSWCLEKGYCKENVFLSFKPKRKEDKKRILIDADTRIKITQYWDNSPMLLVCHLVYYSLIRPKEIRNIKVSDISLENHYIKIDSSIAKNHHTRYAVMSPEIERIISKMELLKYGKQNYIFSDRESMKPGKMLMYDHKFAREWDKMRTALNLPSAMQLYSLRDSGIYDKLKAGVDDLSVMQAADHSSLDITTIYANHADAALNSKIRAKAPAF
jgi:site-specific recombinase XerD